jgi:hypothetical protein
MSGFKPISLGAVTGATSDEYYEKLAVMRANIAAQLLASINVADSSGNIHLDSRVAYAVSQADALMRELHK